MLERVETEKQFSDESGLRRVIEERLEQNAMGEISIEDITNFNPDAARAVEFENTEGRGKLVRKTAEHLDAEKNLRVKTGVQLKEVKRNLAKQRRRYRA